jgi:hypothetical protein
MVLLEVVLGHRGRREMSRVVPKGRPLGVVHHLAAGLGRGRTRLEPGEQPWARRPLVAGRVCEVGGGQLAANAALDAADAQDPATAAGQTSSRSMYHSLIAWVSTSQSLQNR